MKHVGSPPSDDEIDSLLAHERFPVSTQERIFDRVVKDPVVAARARRRRVWRFSLGGLALAIGTAAVILLVRGPRVDDGFRAKGSAAFGLDLAVTCVDAGEARPLNACPQGATLVFTLVSSASRVESVGYLAAYAEPRDGGERIWYFSSDGETPAVPAAAAGDPGTRGFSKAIRVGPEHHAGNYHVTLLVTRVPLAKAALVARAQPGEILLARELDFTVVATGK